MLTGVRIVFLGGDARQIEIIRKCVEMDAGVSTVGFDLWEGQLPGAAKAELTDSLLSEADALVLPVVGCDDEGQVGAKYSSVPLRIGPEQIAALPAHCTVYTGMAKPFLRKLCRERGLRLTELLEQDDVAIYNSIPTAEGALAMVIQNTDFTIHGSAAVVLGMGRTGFTMARSLQGLGARVRVGVRRREHYARAEEMGWQAFMTEDLGRNLADADLVFNTIPSMILNAQMISKLPAHACVIDLASSPGGTDFRYAEKRGIRALLAPGLPGIVAPKTAGIIMANALVECIRAESREQEG
ncbi:dipicolinate synthase subunit DpsA [Paenibacillus glufosinatiresistens]|uniref:dipicolinate synthase subunit DpsA n=1 Tax=Paenibacillus glufosinatiresistens TaxID=3070657 RepID=UPI00286E8247|nr:dipicolinate synthase subunit DpsA [Paenibacillus sp. YX.27]